MKLVGVDVETTGTDFENDRICEVALIEYNEDLVKDGGAICQVINPGVEMLDEVVAIHNITNDMVRDSPPFEVFAQEIQQFLDDSIIIGQNVSFDIAFLHYELVRAGQKGLSVEHPTIDTLAIERKLVKHDLASMYKRYFGVDFEGAHRADVDVEATVKVLGEQIDAHGLTEIPIELVGFSQPEGKTWVDFSRNLYRDQDGQVKFAFGKFKDCAVRQDNDTVSYAVWMCRQGFPEQTKEVLRELLYGDGD